MNLLQLSHTCQRKAGGFEGVNETHVVAHVVWLHTCFPDDCLLLQPVKKAKKNDGAAAPKAAAKSEVDTSATNGSKTVFCKNLPWGATDEDLSGFFADCGEVTDCRIGMMRTSPAVASLCPDLLACK